MPPHPARGRYFVNKDLRWHVHGFVEGQSVSFKTGGEAVNVAGGSGWGLSLGSAGEGMKGSGRGDGEDLERT